MSTPITPEHVTGRFRGGAQTFVHKGENGRWRDTLTKEDVAGYEAAVLQELGADCARWLATGQR